MYSEWMSCTFLRGTSEWSTREKVISFLTFFLPDKSTCSTRTNTCQSGCARVSEQHVCNWQTGWRFIIHCRELTSPFLFHPEMRKTFQTWHCLIGSVQHVWVLLCGCFLRAVVSVCACVLLFKKTGPGCIPKSLPWIYLKKSAHVSHTHTHTHTQRVLHVWAVEGVWGVSWMQRVISEVGERGCWLCWQQRCKEVKNSYRGEKKAKVLNKRLHRKVSWSDRDTERHPTIFFGSEQDRVAGGAVTHLCVRQHLQHVHRVFLETPEEHRHAPLSICHLNTGGTFWVLLTVQHLVTDTQTKNQKNR